MKKKKKKEKSGIERSAPRRGKHKNEEAAAMNTISGYTVPEWVLESGSQVFQGEWDSEGVYFYQAYGNEIADWALEHQQFGGPSWKPVRMTWIKPSFAWMLYRSDYGCKHGQQRILKVKLSHEAVGNLLSQCKCQRKGGGSLGRVQWDPARDLFTAEGNKHNSLPRKTLRERAIQIGIKGRLSEFYVENILSIEEVTDLAHEVEKSHTRQLQSKSPEEAGMEQELMDKLPDERPYLPICSYEVLVRLGMMPGERADDVARIGRGKVDSF